MLLLALVGAAPAQAASMPAPDDAVALLNAWRSSVGLAPVVHDETLTSGCRKHAKYYGLNPTHRLHSENPSAAGYTKAGDVAARSSVLVYGDKGPGAGIVAWESAPYHRMALLDPRLTSTGFWSEFGISCMQAMALDHGLRTPALTAYTYPIGGQRNVATTFWCNENPNPCEAVPGNGGDTPTGMNVSIQFNGPWLRVASVLVGSASLAAAGGPTVAMTVQSRPGLLRGGIVLIPHEPLSLGQTYVATVSGTVAAAADDGTISEHPYALSWDFSTPGIEPAASLKVVVERVTRTRVHLRLGLRSADPRVARISLLQHRTPLVRVTRRLTGRVQRVIIPRPRERITTVNVLLRGGPEHLGVASRLATDIPAVSARDPAFEARR